MPHQDTLDIAYLVLAHQHPEQLSRLVEQLRSPAADMFVHVDAKVPIEPFLQAAGADVHFTSTRIPVYWADYSQIRAVLLLIEAALAVPRKYDYLVLLSGVDYPLRSAAEIEDFLAQNKGYEFINWVAMPSVAASKPLSRLTDYHGRPGLLGRLRTKARRLLIKLRPDTERARLQGLSGPSRALCRQHLVGSYERCMPVRPDLRRPEPTIHEIL